jgi:hypothetical protein
MASGAPHARPAIIERSVAVRIYKLCNAEIVARVMCQNVFGATEYRNALVWVPRLSWEVGGCFFLHFHHLGAKLLISFAVEC